MKEPLMRRRWHYLINQLRRVVCVANTTRHQQIQRLIGKTIAVMRAVLLYVGKHLMVYGVRWRMCCVMSQTLVTH